MKKSLLPLLLLVVLTAGTTFASPLSPDEALKRVYAGGPIDRAPAKVTAPTAALAYSANVGNGAAPAWYAFNLPAGGFIIVGADDVARPLLAYSDEGSFDYQTISPTMKWWLNQYTGEISNAIAQSAPADNVMRMAENRVEKKTIEPLLKTKWNQGDPYNLYCPVKDDKKTYTGCVATAQAQFMKYFNYPEKGSGTHTYVWNGQELTMDFSARSFDWNNMTDTYNKNSSDEQKQAVAYLMQACGYSVNMDYGTAESAAKVYEWAPSLVNYFGYAVSTTTYSRQYFGLYQWEDMVYESLAGGSPVLYAGTGSAGGHAFVCDGYDKDGFFHFNWGWSGNSDGYYQLSALDPPYLGVGGGGGAFNYGQIAVFNAKPAFPGAKFVPVIGVDEEMPKISYSNASKNLSLTGYIFNFSNRTLEFKPGFIAENEKGEKFYAGATQSFLSLDVLEYIGSFSRKFPTVLPDGKYKIYPAYAVAKEGSENELEWHRILLSVECPQYYELTMSGGKGTMADAEKEATLKAEDFKVLSIPRVNFPLAISAKIVNTSKTTEARENIYAILVDAAGAIIPSPRYPVNIPVGESVDFEVSFTPLVNQKEYKLYLVTSYDVVTREFAAISEGINVKFAAPAAVVTLTPQTFDITAEMNQDGDGAIVTVSTDVKCVAGYYGQGIMFWLGETTDGPWGNYLCSSDVMLEEGEVKNVTVTIPFPDAESGGTYYVIANYKNFEGKNAYYEKQPFTVKATGIDDVIDDNAAISLSRNGNIICLSAPEDIKSVEVYSISGMTQSVRILDLDGNSAILDISNLANGIFLVKVATASAIETFKVIK